MDVVIYSQIFCSVEPPVQLVRPRFFWLQKRVPQSIDRVVDQVSVNLHLKIQENNFVSFIPTRYIQLFLSKLKIKYIFQRFHNFFTFQNALFCFLFRHSMDPSRFLAACPFLTMAFSELLSELSSRVRF